MNWEPVIGLEIHAQLLTKSKIFCGCSVQFGAKPNTQTCPVCLGMPGTLPVLNRTAVDLAIRMGLAVNCAIQPESVFARKNYFYPDLPKSYQISQYDQPLCSSGHIEIGVNGARKRIGITRIHLEEDAGKSIHDRGDVSTYVDLNRCGTGLMEIVSDPDIRSAEEAYAYLTKLKQILQYTGVCDCNMEEGSLRCDANVSVRPLGQQEFGTKTELKNMNSFRNVEKAIKFEIERQIGIIENGGNVVQETLLWDAAVNTARIMREKENAHDYRYFPEPDLLTLKVDKEWIERVKAGLPELPDARRGRFVAQYGIPEYDAGVLTESRETADYYEKAVTAYGNPKSVSNWVMSEVMRVIKEDGVNIKNLKVTPEMLGNMLKMIDDGSISGKIAKTVFDDMLESGKPPESVVKEKGLVQISDAANIENVIKEVLENNKAQVNKYKSGKTNVFGFFVGETMKATKGKANPKIVNDI